MDKKSKIFFVVFFLLIVLAVVVTFYRAMIARDYTIEAQMDCDPYTERCFTYICDPLVEECSGNPEQDTSYYKVLYREAKNIPLCNPTEEGCEALSCPEGESGCRIVLCDEQSEAEGMICSDPEVYAAAHPIENPNTESEAVTEDVSLENSEKIPEISASNENATELQEKATER